MNKHIIIGNLGEAPMITEVSGVKVANFTVATNKKWTTKEGEPKKKTSWHNVQAWRGLAEVVEKYVKKGDKICVIGESHTRSYDKEDGSKGYTTELTANEIELLSNNPNTPPPPEEPAF